MSVDEVTWEFVQAWQHWVKAKHPGVEVCPIEGIVYVLKVPGKDLFKIGRTTKRAVDRCLTLRSDSFVKGLYVFKELKSIYYACIEKELHTILEPFKRVGGEWFTAPKNRVVKMISYYEVLNMKYPSKPQFDFDDRHYDGWILESEYESLFDVVKIS